MNGMYAPTGGNIDGGTYPADIWGTYMKQAVGSYCGDFKQPDRAVPQPAVPGPLRAPGRQGRRREAGDDRTTARSRARHRDRARERTTRGNGGDTNRGGDDDAADNGGDADNGAAFDPNAVRDPAAGRARDRNPGGGTQAPPTTG